MKLVLCAMMLSLSYFSISYGQNTQTGLKPDTLVKIKSEGCTCQQGKFNQKTKAFIQSENKGYIGCSNLIKFDSIGRITFSSVVLPYPIKSIYTSEFVNVVQIFSYYNNFSSIITKEILQGNLVKHEVTRSYKVSKTETMDSTLDENGVFLRSQYIFKHTDSSKYYSLKKVYYQDLIEIDSTIFNKDFIPIENYMTIKSNLDSGAIKIIELYSYSDSIVTTKRYYQSILDFTHYIKFNSEGLIIWEKHENFATKSLPTEFHYTYEFDEYHNWIKKYVYSEGKLIAIEERTISYYK